MVLHTGEAHLCLGDYYGSGVNRCDRLRSIGLGGQVLLSGATLRELAILVNKSFLTAEPESGRYAVHELLRQYGELALKDNGARYEAVREAHALFYAGLADSAHGDIQNGRQPKALIEMEADIDSSQLSTLHSLLYLCLSTLSLSLYSLPPASIWRSIFPASVSSPSS
jgi:hypothetical protein